MSRSGQARVSSTHTIPVPNYYIQALLGEFSEFAYDESRAPRFRGEWRSKAFGVATDQPLDLEIGTGNGLHFAHRAIALPNRLIVGIELKYKPLIQSIRRALRGNAKNARMLRYNAGLLQELFVPNEIDDVFIFFPDPWAKLRQHKHRLIQDEFLRELFQVQKPGSKLFFKTDSQGYFGWAFDRFARSDYKILASGTDLYATEHAQDNFKTQFESIFVRQGFPIAFTRLEKPASS